MTGVQTCALPIFACDALAQGGVAVGQQHLRPVQRKDARGLGADPRRTSGHDRDLCRLVFCPGAWVVSLVRPKSCPSGCGSAFLENGYDIERDRA